MVAPTDVPRIVWDCARLAGSGDQRHAELILAALPLTLTELDALAADSPFRDGSIADAARCARFDAHLSVLRGWLSED